MKIEKLFIGSVGSSSLFVDGSRNCCSFEEIGASLFSIRVSVVSTTISAPTSNSPENIHTSLNK